MSLEFIVNQFQNYGTEKFSFKMPLVIVSQQELLVYLQHEDIFFKQVKRNLREVKKQGPKFVFDNFYLSPLDIWKYRMDEKLIKLIEDKKVNKQALTSNYNDTNNILSSFGKFLTLGYVNENTFHRIMGYLELLAIDFEQEENYGFLRNLCCCPMVYQMWEEQLVDKPDYEQYFRDCLRDQSSGQIQNNTVRIEQKDEDVFKVQGSAQLRKITYFITKNKFRSETFAEVIDSLQDTLMSRTGEVCLWNTSQTRKYIIQLERLFKDVNADATRGLSKYKIDEMKKMVHELAGISDIVSRIKQLDVIKQYGFDDVKAKEWFRECADDDLENLEVDKLKRLLKV